MIPYYLVFGLIIILALFSNKNSKLNFYDILIMIVLITFSSVRYYVGTDYGLYLNIYDRIAVYGPIRGVEINGVELGYSFLNYLTYRLFGEGYFIFFMSSILIIIPFIVFIKKYSENYVISIIFFYCFSFFTNSLNIQRQYIAAALLLISSIYILKEKYVTSFLFVLTALFFHRTAIVFFIVYPFIKQKKITRKNYIFLFLFGIIATILFDSAISLIARVFDKYALYEGTISKPGIGTLLTVSIFIAFSIALMIRMNANKLAGNKIVYAKIFLLGIPFYIMSIKSYLIMRIGMVYFGVFMIILLPEFFKDYDWRLKIIVYNTYIIVMSIWFYFYLVSQNGVVPYESFFIN